MTFDPRITPARPDLAASHLRGQVQAARFADGAQKHVITGLAPLRADPRPDAPLLTEALHGEVFTVYDEEEGWAWGQLETDGYVGWLAASALGEGSLSTHRVAALRTLVFPGPDIKLPPVDSLSINARITAVEQNGPFLRRANGGYVWAAHMSAPESVERDPVAVALRFVGVPYLWGGRSALGIDCSGLMQMALAACGVAVQRDSDMQFSSIGTVVPEAAMDTLRRGDLIFWKGHVAMAMGDDRMVHANAHHMAVAIEGVREGVERISRTDLPVLGIRRCELPLA